MKKITTTQINPKLLQPSPELIRLQHLMPISPDDRTRLENDIVIRGVLDAIDVYQNKDGEFFILDGFNRYEIALSLEIEIVPITIFEGTTEDFDFFVQGRNLNRRHLTQKQKQGLIAKELESNPCQSDRVIAGKINTHHSTVAKVRKEKGIETDKRVGKDGKMRKITQKEKNKVDKMIKKQSELSSKSNLKMTSAPYLKDIIKNNEKNPKEIIINKTSAVGPSELNIICPHCGKEI